MESRSSNTLEVGDTPPPVLKAVAVMPAGTEPAPERDPSIRGQIEQGGAASGA